MPWMELLRMLLGVLGLVAFGGVLLGIALSTPGWRGIPMENFDGRRFRNPQATRAEQGPGSLLRWLVTRRPRAWNKERVIVSDHPPERSQSLRITWVNHATFLVQVGGVNLLIDPIWSDYCAPLPVPRLRRHHMPGVTLGDLPPIDAVLISHNHYDHLDLATLRQLKHLGTRSFVTGLGNGELLRKNGIEAREIVWWDRVEIQGEGGSITVHGVPAQHFSSRGILDRNKNLWMGFVMEHASEGRVYHAGDTAWGGHFKQICERLGPTRVALLPIGAFLPRWFMSPVHMGPEEVPAVQDALGKPTVIPMHWACFHLGDDGEGEALDLLQRVWIEQDRDPQSLATLDPGGVWGAEEAFSGKAGLGRDHGGGRASR